MHPHDLATEPMFQFELIWFALKALNKMNCFLFASTFYLSFLWFSLKACYFLLLTNTSHLIQLLPNRPKSECKLSKFTMIQICPFCWVKVPKLQKNMDQSIAANYMWHDLLNCTWNKNSLQHRLWLAVFFALRWIVWPFLILSAWFNMTFQYNYIVHSCSLVVHYT